MSPVSSVPVKPTLEPIPEKSTQGTGPLIKNAGGPTFAMPARQTMPVRSKSNTTADATKTDASSNK